MNSPLDPGSPTDSTSTSGTPPPEEIINVSAPGDSRSGLGLFQLANHITAAFTGSSKRRNPSSGTSGAGSSARDTKSRRRGDGSRSTWETRDPQGTRKEKDELVDANIVDFLRKGTVLISARSIHLNIESKLSGTELGDPFLEVSTSTLPL